MENKKNSEEIWENIKWIECKTNNVKTFRLEDDPVLIHIIKTGFQDKYMVVYEDAYEVDLGKVITGTKKEIENEFNIVL